MRTPAWVVAIPVVALTALLASCSDDGSSSGTTTGGVPTSTISASSTTVADSSSSVAATTVAPTTTVAPATTTAPIGSSVAPAGTTGPSGTSPATTDPVTRDRPVIGGSVEVIVQVGVDDATTLGGRTEQVPLGSSVELRLFSPSAEEYHVHGFDLDQTVPGGVEAVFLFTADRTGSYEVESHTTGRLLVVLQVA